MRRRAHLLLPSPLGPVTYDVLESAVYVGPATRGGLTADPLPFPEAVVALTWQDEPAGFVLRALPGEAAPTIDGRPAEGVHLQGGERIQVAGAEMTFVSAAPPAGAAAPPPAAVAPAGRRGGRERPATVRPRANPWVGAVALVGALVLLVAVYRALDHLGSLREGEKVRVFVPEPPTVPDVAPASVPPAREAYDEVTTWEAAHADDLDGVVARYREVLRRFPDSPEADRARSRIRELYESAARAELKALGEGVEARIRDHEFQSALKAIRNFERRYGATAAADGIQPLVRRVREAAQKALDELLAEVGPLMSTNARQAHRRLLIAAPEYPPDLAAEITDLMDRAIALMRSQGRPPPERTPPGTPETPETPPTPADGPRSPREEPPPGDTPEGREAAARRQWQDAYDLLQAGRYPEALDGYSLLLLRYGGTDLVREYRDRVTVGRRAARAGAQGPAGLLAADVTTRGRRLEVEYGFDDARIWSADFDVDQPFTSDRPVTAEPERGALRLSGATGLLHTLVWEPDVRIEARVTAEIAHDFGALAVAEEDEYRAILLTVNNTRFRLKKGDAARAQAGHLLWFVGEGAWADADADAFGYVKIAERSTVKIQDGDRLTLELIRRGDQCEGSFHGRTDGVTLKGQVRGDDGRGMGSARVGLFTNTGVLLVEQVKISGTVDMAWFQRHLARLVATTPPPP